MALRQEGARQSRLAKFRIALWLLIALLGGAALAFTFRAGGSGNAAAALSKPYGAPFQLVDANGATITESSLRGRPSAVFFGFTHCPEVCPTTLAELGGAREELRKEGKDFQIVFVTVDPERDTPQALKDYVGAIAPDVVAVTGPRDRLDAMLKSWGVYWKKVGEGDDYTMDHTATTFLIDRKGRLAGTLGYDEPSATAKLKLERLASGEGA